MTRSNSSGYPVAHGNRGIISLSLKKIGTYKSAGTAGSILRDDPKLTQFKPLVSCQRALRASRKSWTPARRALLNFRKNCAAFLLSCSRDHHRSLDIQIVHNTRPIRGFIFDNKVGSTNQAHQSCASNAPQHALNII